jgi:hypothetical protein
LNRVEFEKALHLGLGRVILFLRENDDMPYRDLIRFACIHLTTFDTQVEGTRAKYFYEVIQATRDPAYYRKEVASAVRAYVPNDEPDKDGWFLFEVAGLLAAHGDDELKELIYQKFVECLAGNDDQGAAEIVRIDKQAGLLFAAERIGPLLAGGHESRFDYQLLSIAEDAGIENPENLLQQSAQSRPGIGQFLSEIEKIRRRERKSRTAWRRGNPVNLVQLRAALDEGRWPKTDVSTIGWGQKASEADLRQAAQWLAEETRIRPLKLLIRIFYRVTYPLGPDPLIKLVSHPDAIVAAHALTALENLAHPDVRALALRVVEGSDELAARAVAVLNKNFGDDDQRLIDALAHRLTDPTALHLFATSTLEYFRDHHLPESEMQVLVQIYEMNPCGWCRASAVRRLIELGFLPDWMRAECAWDSNLEIREMVSTDGATDQRI